MDEIGKRNRVRMWRWDCFNDGIMGADESECLLCRRFLTFIMRIIVIRIVQGAFKTIQIEVVVIQIQSITRKLDNAIAK